MLQKNLLTAVAYALAGWLALTLAIPPDFASPFYPSAGLALAAVLAWGPGVLPGVALGAFVANLGMHALHGELSLLRGAVCASIGLGAALQAGLGAALVRRCCPGPLALETPAEVSRFFLVGGPLACVASASWAVATFWLAGVLQQPQQLGFTLWTWWLGDTLGVLVGAPLVLAFLGEPRAQWRPRRLTLALPLGLVTAVIGVAIALIGHWERERLERVFERDVGVMREQVRDGISHSLGSLEALHGLARASDALSAEAFRRATEGWLARHADLAAMGWSTHVPVGGQAGFEARMQAQRPGFRIFDREPGGPQGDASVITHVEPLAANRSVLGLNSRSIPAVREAIERAVAQQAPAASEGFLLTQDLRDPSPSRPSPGYGVVVYRAVMSDSAPEGGPAALRGSVFITLRVQEAFGALLSQAGVAGLQGCLLERGTDGPRLLAGAPSCLEDPADAGAAARRHEEPLTFAGREWTLRVLASPGYVAGHQSRAVWSFAALGLLTTAMLGVFLLLFTGRTLRIEEAVRRRTAELQEEVGRRRHAQQALQDSERRFREIFDTAPVGIACTDLAGGLRRVNPRLCEIAGRGAAELEALGLPDLVSPEERATVRALLAELREGRGERVQQRLHCRRRDGGELWAQFTASRLDMPGEGASLVAIVEDITERLQLEDAERAREIAERANQAKTEFLSRMSHELRTPLNAMLGCAQLLALDPHAPLSPAQRQWVGHIEQAGWHLLALIDDVLDLSRVESGSLGLSPRPVVLATLLEESLALVRAQAAALGIGLELRHDPAAPAARADPTRLKQILANLLSNAVKYNRPQGRVVLECVPAGEARVLLRVSDTGPGLDAAQQARLFQPFDRLGRERSGIQGVGIGLVISRRLAQAMDGELRCDSVPGEGAVFTLELPAAALPPQPGPAGAGTPPGG